MFKKNPNIFIINVIYKMNQYGLFYINIIGQTMIGIFFFVRSFFINKKDNGGYDWLMGWFRALYNHL